jgi:hypothetical protein
VLRPPHCSPDSILQTFFPGIQERRPEWHNPQAAVICSNQPTQNNTQLRKAVVIRLFAAPSTAVITA